MRNRRILLYLVLSILVFPSAWGFAQGDIEEIRQLIVEKTNALRAAKGLPRLLLLDSLMDLAQEHSKNMVLHHFYAHVDHLGQDPVQRAEHQKVKAWTKRGNRWVGIAENIAQTPWFENVRGCGDTRSEEGLATCMVNGWKNSPPHYQNIMGDFTHLGVGVFFDEKGRAFGTQNFR